MSKRFLSSFVSPGISESSTILVWLQWRASPHFGAEGFYLVPLSPFYLSLENLRQHLTIKRAFRVGHFHTSFVLAPVTCSGGTFGLTPRDQTIPIPSTRKRIRICAALQRFSFLVRFGAVSGANFPLKSVPRSCDLLWTLRRKNFDPLLPTSPAANFTSQYL
jgi:hypothetical protein